MKSNRTSMTVVSVLMLVLLVGTVFVWNKVQNRHIANSATTSVGNDSVPVGSNASSATNTTPPDIAVNDKGEPVTPVPAAVPNSTAYYVEKAASAANQKNYPEAISQISEAIKLDPTTSNYYKSKADYQVYNKDKAGAIQTLEVAIKLIPDDETLQTKLTVVKSLSI